MRFESSYIYTHTHLQILYNKAKAVCFSITLLSYRFHSVTRIPNIIILVLFYPLSLSLLFEQSLILYLQPSVDSKGYSFLFLMTIFIL